MDRSLILCIACLLAMIAAPAVASGESGASPPDRAQRFTLKLAEFTFDPLLGEPDLPAGWDRSARGVSDLHLVQLDGPVTPEAEAVLRQSGLTIVRYLYPNTYIVWGRAEQRQGLAGRPAVRWTGDFAPAYRVQRRWRELEGPQDVRVLLYRGADVESALGNLQGLGGTLTSRRVLDDDLELAGFSLPGEVMRQAAGIPGVYSIQLRPTDGGSRGEISAQINAGNVDGLNVPVTGYQAWLTGLGLDGTGVVIASVDEGVDEAHLDLAASMLPCAGSTCSTQTSNHGTHTAGIMVGDGASAVLDASGFARGLGVSPGASLIEQRYWPAWSEPNGMLNLMRDSRANGAVISNNSWGPSTTSSGYDLDTMLVDMGVRDADPDTPGNQEMTYVLSIANGDGGYQTQGTPDEGKNLFSVGSTLAVGGDGNPDDQYDNLASGTAHGPALDGRWIPNIVAPGCWVDSTYPEDEGDMHNGRCGTSFAAPQVSGAAALFVERYRGLSGGVDPSPALVKAAFMAVAHDLEGNMDADGTAMGHRPDSKQGWGRLNLSAVVDPPAGSVIYVDQTTTFDFTGQEWMRVVTSVDPAKPMYIMLTWTDAPGHGLGGDSPALNNDLDLVIEAAGDVYKGNNFGTDGFSEGDGTGDASPDDLNNVEATFFQVPPVGDVTVRVKASNINSDGVPSFGDKTDQDFALVCYNCDFVPAYALATSPGSLEICAPEDGAFSVDVEQLAGFADPVTLSVAGLPPGASDSFSVNPVVPGNASVLTIDPGTAVDGDYVMDLDGDASGMTRTTSFELRIRTAMPPGATLTAPADAAVDVEVYPVLEWDPLSWVGGYLVEVATDPAFDVIVYSALEDGTSHEVANLLKQQATYYWRVRATNACGFGTYSPVFSFTTADVAPVLLVDDDYDLPDVSAEYKNALDALGVTYDVWDVWALEGQQEPSARKMGPYDKVVWFSGEEEVYAGPTAASEEALEHWADRMGCLFLSSQDYILNREYSAFMADRLGLASFTEDTGETDVDGTNQVFGHLGPYQLQNRNPDYADVLVPDVTAEIAFTGVQGNAGIQKDGGHYRTTFTGFGLERLPNNGGVQDTLDAFFGWCDELDTLDTDLDGVVNADDCLPGDPNAWGTPGEITGLTLSKVPGSEFTWTVPPGGSGAVYDVIRTSDPRDFYNATCVASGVTTTSAGADEDPGVLEAFFYQVRTRNECGQSPLGDNLDGSPRYGLACQ